MPELLNHKHCKNCGRAVPASEELCDDEACQKAWAGLVKRRARMQLLFYASGAALLLLLVYQLLQPVL